MSLQPLFLVKTGSINRRDIKRVEKLTGICMVECSDPAAARFLDAPPDAKLDVQARAALELVRVIIGHTDQNFSRGWITKWFVDALLNGIKPQPPAAVKR